MRAAIQRYAPGRERVLGRPSRPQGRMQILFEADLFEVP
jgi:hypothetical protein